MARDLSKFWLYRYRYLIGYGITAIVLAGLLVFAGLYVPGGLSQAEQRAVVTSASLDFTDLSSLLIVNLPYHALQAGVLHLFGITDFTIKLPALILGLMTALGLIFLLRRWFPANIAVLASLIAVTTGQFLLIAQSGSGAVLYIFWPVMLLLLGTLITRAHHNQVVWKVLFTIAAGLSLYTPLAAYTLAAIAITIALHPHLRLSLKRLPKIKLFGCALLFGLIITPLIMTIIQTPQTGLTLLGLPSTQPDLLANAQLIATQYFTFWSPSATSVLTPVFGLGSALLIALGFYRLIRTRETTRSYLIIIWIVCLAPILIFSPQYISVVFVPAVLLLAAGLTSLIGYWYRLFPFNPYARVTGLVPIIVLVGVLITSGIDRYVFGYHYSPTVAANYSEDLMLLPDDTKQLVVAPSEKPFYDAVATFSDTELTVSETAPATGAFIATRAQRTTAASGETITRIIVSPFAEQSDRFYQYDR